MNKNITEGHSAFVVVSRKTIIISLIGTSLLSFASGYLLGYEGSPSDKLVTRVEADSKKVVSEEKTVLDASGKTKAAEPVVTPGVIPKELIPRPSVQNRQPPKQTAEQVKPEPEVGKSDEVGRPPQKTDAVRDGKASAEKPRTEQKIVVEKREDKAAPEKLKLREPQKAQAQGKKKHMKAGKPQAYAKKKAVERLKGKRGRAKALSGTTEKRYSVQVGSFLDPQKAARLRQDLQGKGYTAHIVPPSAGGGKYHKVRIGAYSIKADAEELLPKLRKTRLDCIVVPAWK
jgi:DedD protein